MEVTQCLHLRQGSSRKVMMSGRVGVGRGGAPNWRRRRRKKKMVLVWFLSPIGLSSLSIPVVCTGFVPSVEYSSGEITKRCSCFFLMFKSFFPWDRLSSFGCPYLLCEMSSLISFRSHYHEFSTPPRNTCLFRLKGGGGGGFVWGNNGILLWWSGFLSLCLSSFIYLKYAFFTFTTCISHLVSCFNYYALPKMGDGSVANIFH